MTTIITILILSILGFSGFLAMDIPALQGKRWKIVGVAILAILSLVTAFTIATHEGYPIGISVIWQWIGIPMMGIGISLMLYSTLIEIPLASLQSSISSKDVYTNGTYALCRHPGFLWMLIYLTGFVLVYNLTSAIGLAIYWLALELVVIYIQDRVIFPHRFPSYDSYQLATPFIIPTLSSLRTFSLFLTTRVSHD
jgi:protein-S-isoprenylcysteine O-methyltransferase Ste14